MPCSLFETSKIWLSSSLSGGLRSRIVLTLGSVLLYLFLFSRPAIANNVVLAEVELVDRDTSAKTVGIEFDLSWENGWKDSVNHDAVWVFAKYCTSNCSTNGVWSHATLKTSGVNPNGFSRGTKKSGAFSSLDLIVPPDKVGAFIQPASPGSGAVDFLNIKLLWDYGQDGVSDSDAGGYNMRVRVFAIEMVYVPQERFYAEDDSGTYGEIEYGGVSSSKPGRFQVKKRFNLEMVPGCGITILTARHKMTRADRFSGGGAFPKGFKAFTR